MAEVTTRQGGEPLSIDGGQLGTFLFVWDGDRYKHTWADAGGKTILSSIEDTENWPASPPMQQIHQQSFADGREVIFGVGMAGRGHWSASFTLVPDLKCWIVELACRSPVSPDHLSSTYQIDGAAKLTDAGATQLATTPDFLCEAIAPATLELAEQKLTFRPAKLPSEAATTQWAFRLRCDG